MLRQSHWKTQIEGLMKRQFVMVSVHSARVCTHGKGATSAHVPPTIVMPLAVNLLHPPPEQRIPPTGPPPIEPTCLQNNNQLKIGWGGGSRGSGNNNNDGRHGAAANNGLQCNSVRRRVRSRGISGSWRGEHDVSLPMANPRTTIPWGVIVARRGRLMPSSAVRGRELLARRR